MVWLARAHVEWFTGDEEKVGGLLERAGGCENTTDGRAAIFQNQALLGIENDLGQAPITCLHSALACGPSAPLAGVFYANLMVFCALRGQSYEVGRAVAQIEHLDQLSHTRSRLQSSKIALFIRYLAKKHGVNAQRTEQAVQWCTGAIHGI
jgi:hypothetical protein